MISDIKEYNPFNHAIAIIVSVRALIGISGKKIEVRFE